MQARARLLQHEPDGPYGKTGIVRHVERPPAEPPPQPTPASTDTQQPHAGTNDKADDACCEQRSPTEPPPALLPTSRSGRALFQEQPSFQSLRDVVTVILVTTGWATWPPAWAIQRGRVGERFVPASATMTTEAARSEHQKLHTLLLRFSDQFALVHGRDIRWESEDHPLREQYRRLKALEKELWRRHNQEKEEKSETREARAQAEAPPSPPHPQNHHRHADTDATP